MSYRVGVFRGICFVSMSLLYVRLKPRRDKPFWTSVNGRLSPSSPCLTRIMAINWLVYNTRFDQSFLRSSTRKRFNGRPLCSRVLVSRLCSTIKRICQGKHRSCQIGLASDPLGAPENLLPPLTQPRPGRASLYMIASTSNNP